MSIELQSETITTSLSHVDRTLDGKGYAFIKLDINGKGIESLGSKLSTYKHIRYLKAHGNKIKDITPLIDIDALLAVNMEKNLVEKIPPFSNKYLQYLNLSENKVTSFEGADAPFLNTLNLTTNEVSSLNGMSKLKGLTFLDLTGNKLANIDFNEEMTALKEIVLDNCGIEKIVSLGGLKGLEKLKLSGNSSLAELDGLISLKNLQKLNISGTGVANLSEISKLKSLSKLKEIELNNAPVGEGENARQEILILLPLLQSLNNEAYTNEERAAARDIALERQKKMEEESKIKAEEQEKSSS